MTVLTYFYENCPLCGRSIPIRVQWQGQWVRCRYCHTATQASRDKVSALGDELRHSRAISPGCTSCESPTDGGEMDSDNQPIANREEADLAERSILLVDDDRGSLESMSRHLTRKGYYVTPVHHARMALEAMSIQPHCVAVVNRRLPEFDGAQLMEMLRRYVHDVQVIILSGNADAADRRSLLAAGAFDCLTKPCSMKVLEDSVRRALDSTSAEKVAPSQSIW